MKHITVRAFLQAQKIDKKGNSPIAICVTAEGKRSYKFSGFKVPAKDWDADSAMVKKTFANGALINSRLKILATQVEEEILKQQLSGKKITIQGIRRQLRNENESREIFEYATELISHLENKFSPGTILIYHNEINHLNNFAPGIQFNEIDPVFLRKYESYLIAEGISQNSIHKNWKIIKRIFNCAINDGVTDNYPFKKYDNPKYRQTEKDYLTQFEVDKIENAMVLPMSDYMMRVGYYFLFSCYSGLRFSDYTRFNPSWISEGRLILRTKKNGVCVSMKIHDRLAKVLEVIKRISPDLDNQKCNEYLKGIATMAGISKVISTHTGRRTFACLCAEKGISKESCAEFMGVSERVVSVYYKVTEKKLDQDILLWDKK